jgi:hypothetical protein
MVKQPASGRQPAPRSPELRRAIRRTALLLAAIAIGMFVFTLVRHWS